MRSNSIAFDCNSQKRSKSKKSRSNARKIPIKCWNKIFTKHEHRLDFGDMTWMIEGDEVL